MSSLPKTQYTPEQYLALERAAEYKSELVNGEIYAMSGASRKHNLVSANLLGEIRAQLKGKPCETYGSDMRVMVDVTGMYTYPDVTMACGEPRFEDASVDTLLNPTILIEVLSPSTEAYDRGDMFAHYRKLPSLQEYILISQDKPRAEHYARQTSNTDQWLLTEISGLDGLLSLPSIGCAVAMQDVYDRVVFGPNSLLPEAQSQS